MNRRLQDICILMYKVKHRLCPTYICNIFKNHNSFYFLRQSDFSISNYNTVTYGKHSLRYLGPRLWGTLSPDVRHTKTLDAFKNKIRGCDVSLLVDDGCKGCSPALHSCFILSSLSCYYHHYYHLYINFLAGLSLNYYIIRPSIF